MDEATGKGPCRAQQPEPPTHPAGAPPGLSWPPLPPLFATFPRRRPHGFKDRNTCANIFGTPNLGEQAWRSRKPLSGDVFSMTQETGGDRAPRSRRDLLMSPISSPQLTALSFPLYNPHDFDSFPSVSRLVGEKSPHRRPSQRTWALQRLQFKILAQFQAL